MAKWLKSILIVAGSLILLGGAIYGVLRLVKSRSASEVNVYRAEEVCTTYSGADQAETEGQVTTDRIQSVYVTNTQQVTEIYVEEGQSVKTGDPILAFDTTLNDLELERKRIDIEQLKLDLENAKKERAEMDTYSVYSASGSSRSVSYDNDDTRSLTSVVTPYLRKGSGTAADPYIFVWGEFDTYSEAFISQVIFKGATLNPIGPIVPEAPEPMPTPDEGETPAETPTTETPGEAPDPTPEATPAETPASTPEATPASTPDAEPEPDVTPVPDATSAPGNSSLVRYAIFERREADSPEGELLDVWQMVFEIGKGGELVFTMGEPEPDYDSSAIPDFPDYGGDSGYSGPTYTWSELQKMKAEQDRKIIDLNFRLRTAQLEYETIEYELSNGVVYSKIDGVVKTVRTVDEALAEDQPVVLLSGGGGYYVQGYMGELDLETMKVGDEVNVMSWESGEQLTGTITEISDYPLDENSYGWYWSQGNSNISKYPFTIFLDEDAPLRENEYVNITFTPGEQPSESDGEKLYLQNPFLRQENGRSYVYVQGEGDLLEKRYVTTGKNLWGSYTEIKSGLARDEYIAFPYGKSVVEGAKTVQVGIDELYNSMYY